MFFINNLTHEAEMVPHPTKYAELMMYQRGFVAVSEKEFDDYTENHFND